MQDSPSKPITEMWTELENESVPMPQFDHQNDEQEYASEGQDKRAHKRYTYVGKAAARPTGGFLEQHGIILDLSLGGCLIQLDEPLDVLIETEIEVNLQSSYLACRAFATIRRFSEDKRILGCSFERLTKTGLTDLQGLICDLENGRVEAVP